MLRVLDLFCCAGGASSGYDDAGFKAEGVDIAERPNYPYGFTRADALEYLAELIRSGEIREFDLIHASPPCQAACALTLGTNATRGFVYPDHYEAVVALITESGVPGVVENPRARADITLCGEMFGLGVLRHRKFELIGWTMPKPAHKPHRGRVRGYRHGEWFDGPYIAAYGNGGGKGSVSEMQDAMCIHWTDVREELTEAIPPAYTRFIGNAFKEWKEAALW